MSKTILISGGSGLVGSRISQIAIERGDRVRHLGRARGGSDHNADSAGQSGSAIERFAWDPSSGTIDEAAFEGVDAIIHLAGAGIADKRWTSERKREIIASRVDSSKLLTTTIRRLGLSAPLVNASAIGYYGNRGEEWLSERSEPGNGFLPETALAWEAAAGAEPGDRYRTTTIRIGIVLAREGGALPKMADPVRFGVGAPLGNGKQYTSWIHIDDLARLFLHACNQSDSALAGVINGVAPEPLTNAELTRAIAQALGRPLLLPPVPTFVLKMMLGEMSELVLDGARVKSRVGETGFEFEFSEAQKAVKNLLQNRG